MTPSKTPSTVDESANPDRRGGRRAPVIETCFYQLTHFPDHEIVEFSDGHALSLNTSPEGFLLLMPQSPERGQVFEVHTRVSTEERNREAKRTVKLVEACWMRELTFGAADKVYLVGVRSLFEPTRPN